MEISLSVYESVEEEGGVMYLSMRIQSTEYC